MKLFKNDIIVNTIYKHNPYTTVIYDKINNGVVTYITKHLYYSDTYYSILDNLRRAL